MKKIVTMFLIATLLLALAACETKNQSTLENKTPTATSTATEEVTSITSSPQNTKKPTTTPIETTKPESTPQVTQKSTTKPTATPTVKPTETPTVKPTVTPTAKPTETPHIHSYGKWETIQTATCSEEGEKIRNCSCGKSESQQLSKIEHNYSGGACTMCGKTDPDNKQKEIKAENDRYEREAAALRGTIDADKSMLKSTMKANGISYLISYSECQRKISQLEDECDSLSRKISANRLTPGMQSEIARMERELEELRDELTTYMVMETLIERQERIEDLERELEILELEHQQNLNMIEQKYS